MFKRDVEKTKFHDENGQYRKLPINWFKVLIALISIVIVITLIVSIWGWGAGGFKFLKMKNEAKDVYEIVYVNHDVDKYLNETSAIIEPEVEEMLIETSSKLSSQDYSYSKKSYAVEISLKTNRNDCWIAVTDKTRTKNDNPDHNKPEPTVFIHEIFEKNTLFIKEVKDVYDFYG